MTKKAQKQKQKAISHLEVGSFIYDGVDSYKVTRIYKSGVQYEHKWKNWAGTFHEYKFVTYAKLYGEDWTRFINKNSEYDFDVNDY